MEEYPGSPALDAGLLAAAQAVEHKCHANGALRTWALELGMKDAAKLLQTTLDQRCAYGLCGGRDIDVVLQKTGDLYRLRATVT